MKNKKGLAIILILVVGLAGVGVAWKMGAFEKKKRFANMRHLNTPMNFRKNMPYEREEPVEQADPTFNPSLDWKKMYGEWIRVDGVYSIKVVDIDSEGNLKAEYYNPNPIKVSRTKTLNKGKEMAIFLELQADEYPGSKYNLIYDPREDRLNGHYFHAVQDRYYQVSFKRKTEE